MTLDSGDATVSDTSAGIFCDLGNTPQGPPPVSTPSPSLYTDNLAITHYQWGALIGGSELPQKSGCHFRLESSRLVGNHQNVVSQGCVGGRNVITSVEISVDPSVGNTLLGAPGNSVVLGECVGSIVIIGNTFDATGGGGGATLVSLSQSDGMVPPGNYVEFEGNRFTNAANGLVLSFNATVDHLMWNTFTGLSNAAVFVDSMPNTTDNPRIKKARGNVITNNGFGFYVNNNNAPAAATDFDFGNASDPGNNTFACNSSLMSGMNGYDVYFAPPGPSALTLPFRGNKWDHVPPSTSGGNGQDIAIATTGGFSLDTMGATLAGVTCTGGHIE